MGRSATQNGVSIAPFTLRERKGLASFYDKRKQARSVPANATINIETVRPDGARQTFAFRAKGDYLESENDIPEPREFRAIVQVSHGSHTHPPYEVQFSKHNRAGAHKFSGSPD